MDYIKLYSRNKIINRGLPIGAYHGKPLFIHLCNLNLLNTSNVIIYLFRPFKSDYYHIDST